MIRPFTFVRPSAADEAVRAVAGDLEAVFLAGGTNLVDHAFGAQFAEVRVHMDTGEIRVPRLLRGLRRRHDHQPA